jgi:3-oxoacyl-[acyl-carrier protein] reductase
MSSKQLAGRVAIVTGVTRIKGIGNAIAQKLAAQGASVFITYYRSYDDAMPWGVSLDEPSQILESLRVLDVQAQGMEIDLSNPEAPASVFKSAIDYFGQVDILVNNAAYSVDADIFALDSRIIDAHLSVNVVGTLLMCQQYVQHWTQNEGGRIINMSSGQGYEPMPGNLAYAASKGAVDAFTSSLSVEVMPLGITVNAVDPGPTDTGWMSDEVREQMCMSAPSGRLGEPKDAARLVAFLASPEASWITGQVIRSRGGL